MTFLILAFRVVVANPTISYLQVVLLLYTIYYINGTAAKLIPLVVFTTGGKRGHKTSRVAYPPPSVSYLILSLVYRSSTVAHTGGGEGWGTGNKKHEVGTTKGRTHVSRKERSKRPPGRAIK